MIGVGQRPHEDEPVAGPGPVDDEVEEVADRSLRQHEDLKQKGLLRKILLFN